MTLIKYTPQALLNRDRQSTEGWSINNVLLDLSGGLLSFAQVGLNAFARGDLSVITGESVGLWEGGGRLVVTFVR
jgi:cystinosin